jgi:hypothetical protein
MAAYINENIARLDNFYVAMFFNIVCFSIVSFIGFLSYTYFEKRFLARRIVYVRDWVAEKA